MVRINCSPFFDFTQIHHACTSPIPSQSAVNVSWRKVTWPRLYILLQKDARFSKLHLPDTTYVVSRFSIGVWDDGWFITLT